MEFNPFEWNLQHWSIFGVVLFLFLLRRGIKAYNHPMSVLCRQAVNMGWIHCGTITDDGYRNTCLKRNGMEAMLSFEEGNVYMLVPNLATPFKDFIEVEDWVATLDDSGICGGEEVKLVLSALENVEKNIEDSGLPGHSMALKLIRSSVIDMINDEEAVIYDLKESKIDPKDLVYVIMTNAIQTPLTCGTYHTYRGLLGYQGKYLLGLWDYAINQMENSGHYTMTKANDEKHWIRDRIKEVG